MRVIDAFTLLALYCFRAVCKRVGFKRKLQIHVCKYFDGAIHNNPNLLIVGILMRRPSSFYFWEFLVTYKRTFFVENILLI